MMREEWNWLIKDTMSKTYDSVFKNGTREEVLKMLQNKINWNDTDDNGDTVLHAIFRNEKLIETDIIEVLTHIFAQGIDPNIKNNRGQSVTHLAAERKMTNAVNILLNFKANVRISNDRGITSKRMRKSREQWLVLAAIEAKNLSFLTFLRDSDVDFNFRSNHGKTPLHLLVECENYERSSSAFYSNFCNLLVRGGCQVNATDHDGKSALHKASIYGNVPMVRELIELGADVNCRDKEMRTPLHEAAMTNESSEIVELLIKNGAKVNARDSEGDRPLHLVFEKSTFERQSILNVLLKEGAFVDARNNQGVSALYRAMKLANSVSIDELLKYGANVNDLKIRELVRNFRDHALLLLELWIKLSAANLPVYVDKIRVTDVSSYYAHRNECLREIEKLRRTFIDDCTSLYEFLHMRFKRRFAYVNQEKPREKLQHLVESPNFNEQFPKYSVLILGSYREPLIRKSLLERAEEALYELTQVYLPDVIHGIFAYLTNEDLINIIDSTYQ